MFWPFKKKIVDLKEIYIGYLEIHLADGYDEYIVVELIDSEKDLPLEKQKDIISQKINNLIVQIYSNDTYLIKSNHTGNVTYINVKNITRLTEILETYYVNRSS